jgi:glycosyltransferase involved in cell wall biosynthesis
VICIALTVAAMPAYNEEQSIAKMILGCKKYVDEVIVVDDGSTDTTAEIAEALGAHVVRHKVNRGYGAAVRSCFETAVEMCVDKLVIIDSDGQHNPADIPRLLKPLNNGIDLVIGSRFCGGNVQNIPAYRKLGIKVLDLVTNAIGEIKITDSQSGFRSYGKRAIDSIVIVGDGMSAGSEILLQIKPNDLKVEEVGISCTYDLTDASTENSMRHGLGVLLGLLYDMELRRPLYYFTVPGIVFAAIGIALGLDFLRTFYHGGSLSLGPTFLMILLTLMGSIMTFTGIILHSVSRMINQSRKKLSCSKKLRAELLSSGTEKPEYGYKSRNPVRDDKDGS